MLGKVVQRAHVRKSCFYDRELFGDFINLGTSFCPPPYIFIQFYIVPIRIKTTQLSIILILKINSNRLKIPPLQNSQINQFKISEFKILVLLSENIYNTV